MEGKESSAPPAGADLMRVEPGPLKAEPLSFTGRLTLQDTLDLEHYRSLRVVRRPIRWLLGIVSIFIAAVVLMAGVSTHFTWPLYIILAFCAYFPFGWFLLERVRVAQYYRRHPEKYVESTVTLSEDSVSVANVNFDMRLHWNQLHSVVSTPQGLLFLLPPYHALCWLPQRLFEHSGKKEQILDLARKASVQIKQMA
jgi:UPF0716 family protein affecting phage T7 exclusion